MGLKLINTNNINLSSFQVKFVGCIHDFLKAHGIVSEGLPLSSTARFQLAGENRLG